MGKISDTKRAMKIGQRRKMRAKMHKLRAVYEKANAGKDKEVVLKRAMIVNRHMTERDFLNLAPAPAKVVAKTSVPGDKSDKVTSKK